MEKKKGFSVLKFVIMLLCIISVAATLTVNIAFAGGKTPKLMGKYVYVVRRPTIWAIILPLAQPF